MRQEDVLKTLYLVRHAEAVGHDEKLTDAERSLVPRGIKGARRVSRRLHACNGRLDLFFSSPAQRALETAHIFARRFDYPIQRVALHDLLYLASDIQELVGLVAATPNEIERLILFGHDPLLSQLLDFLVAGCKVAMPKGAVAGVVFAGASWSDLGAGLGRLDYFDCPVSRSERARLNRKMRKGVARRLEGQLLHVLKTDIGIDEGEIQKQARSASKQLARAIMANAGPHGMLQRQWARRIAGNDPAAGADS